jgi:hypothetical protein
LIIFLPRLFGASEPLCANDSEFCAKNREASRSIDSLLLKIERLDVVQFGIEQLEDIKRSLGLDGYGCSYLQNNSRNGEWLIYCIFNKKPSQEVIGFIWFQKNEANVVEFCCCFSKIFLEYRFFAEAFVLTAMEFFKLHPKVQLITAFSTNCNKFKPNQLESNRTWKNLFKLLGFQSSKQPSNDKRFFEFTLTKDAFCQKYKGYTQPW